MINYESIKKYKLQISAGLVAFIIIILQSYYIYDIRNQNKALSQKNSTLDSEFKKLGESFQSQGAVFKTEKDALEQAQIDLGKTYVQSMVQAQAQLRVLYTALGEVRSELHSLVPAPVKPSSDGSFMTSLEQQRTGPSLTKVDLSYNGVTKVVGGSWVSYRENFITSIGEWKKKDTGYVAGINLKRKVYRPVGEGKFEEIGEEDIPLTNATATYAPTAFGGEQALDPVPRLSVFGGIGKDTTTNRLVPVLGFDYRITTRVGVGSGIAGNTVFGAVSYRFGK
jgi:hypothetical protein